jgi:hypothetical protein
LSRTAFVAHHQPRQLLGLGTSAKYYIEEGEGYYDITPIRATTAAGDVTFAATDGSSVITVSNTTMTLWPVTTLRSAARHLWAAPLLRMC